MNMDQLIEELTKQLGRVPTEDEVYTFIYGSKAERTLVWNGLW